jgi:hypothetical protein
MAENPGHENTHKYYELTAEEIQLRYMKKMKIFKELYSTPDKNGIVTGIGS